MKPIGPELLEKLNQTLYSKSSNTDPKMSIRVTRAKEAVVDSSYWMQEKIREGSGLGEISIAVRRLNSKGRPDGIYEIHLQDGIVKTAIRAFPDLAKMGFQNQFELGAGLSVSIVFDGDWELFRKKWRIRTNEKPWLFWVSENGNLYAQLWDQTSSRLKLAEGAKKVRALRGWKSTSILSKDQGIIVSYIKTDGQLYYRNFCRQSDGSTLWETEKNIQGIEDAIDFNLFLTNDYRFGIIYQKSDSQIGYVITGRNWAGMAIVPEKLRATAKCTLKPIKVNKKHAYEAEKVTVKPTADIFYLYAGTDNEFELIINTDYGNGDFGRAIYFKTKHPIRNIVPAEFKLMDADGLEFTVLSIVPTSETEYMLFTSDFNNAYGQLKITYMGDTLENPAGGKYGSFEGSFEPVNLVPVNIPIPEVVEVWNE